MAMLWRIAAFSLVLLGLSGANEAFAEDDVKVFNGAQCRPIEMNQSDRLRTSALALTNQSDLDTYIACSLTSDFEDENPQRLDFKVYVTVMAGPQGDTVRCALYSGSPSPWAFSSGSAAKYVYAWGAQTLELGRSPRRRTQVGIQCKLPPRFKLSRIVYAEPLPTDRP